MILNPQTQDLLLCLQNRMYNPTQIEGVWEQISRIIHGHLFFLSERTRYFNIMHSFIF